jgi:membrane-associated protease RseP (regulator of RpoE activity)
MATASLAAVTYAVVGSLAAAHRASAAQAARGWSQSDGVADGAHAVEDLWRRAEILAEAGEVTLARATLPRALAEGENAAGSIHVAPEPRKGGTVGLRVVSVGESGAAALAGVRAGDFITAVNGFRFAAPADGARAFAAARASRAVVAELVRDGKRVVLRVDWA